MDYEYYSSSDSECDENDAFDDESYYSEDDRSSNDIFIDREREFNEYMESYNQEIDEIRESLITFPPLTISVVEPFGDSVANKINDLFDNYSVYTTIIIHNDDYEVNHLIKDLSSTDHSISHIDTVDDCDGRPLYADKLKSITNGKTRMLVLNNTVWNEINRSNNEIMKTVIENHNLLCLIDIDKTETSSILNRIESTINTKNVDNYYLLQI